MAADWLPDIAAAAGPKYKAVASSIAAAVTRGELRQGDRLPPQRDLAARLGIDLTTVTKGYDLARRRGLIVARGRAGSFIAPAARDGAAATAAQTDIAMNSPPIPEGSGLVQAMAEALDQFARGDTLARLHYQRPGGAAADREAGAALLSRIGLPSSADQMLVTAGGQNALHAIAATILRPGDRVACGRHLYPGFRALARRIGVTLVPLERIGAAALAEAHHAAPLRALYVVPTNDSPTTATLPTAERQAIAAWARDAGVPVIEDDAYGLLPRRPLPPITSFAPGIGWYVASMSKILSPALRVAFLRAPDAAQAAQLAATLHESAVMAPPLNAAMVSLWLSNGRFDALASDVRGEAAWRQRLARTLLGDAVYAAQPEGYHLWLPLGEDGNADVLAASLSLDGLSAVPADRFAATEGERERAVRISLSGALDRAALARGLRALDRYLRAPTAQVSPVI
jgi:DNA-binding transcriptional MocR family regulator